MTETAAPVIDDLASLEGRDRAAARTLLLRLADDELVAAERYTEWQVRAPTLESDIALANVAQDELGHARLWYDLCERFGDDETDLIWERDPATFRHATLVEIPFETGDWADAVVRSYLYDVAEDVRLHAIEDSAAAAVRDRVGKVLAEEDYHREHARNWLERLADTEAGHGRVQDAVDRLYPHALTLFEPAAPAENAFGDGEFDGDAAAVEARIDDLGLRTASLDEMRAEWSTRVERTLDDLGLSVPDAVPAEPVGRDGHHTEHWADLHAEMTATYRDLGRDSATRIMDPESDE